MFLALSLSKQNEEDACIWYFINNGLDTFVGIIIVWLLISLLDYIAKKYEIDVLMSGNYYTRDTNNFEDYNINYPIWAIQTLIWCVITCMSKSIIYFIMLSIPKILEDIGLIFLKQVSQYPELELIVVMIIIPFIFNTIQVFF